jgi:hypothetical protein
MNLIDGHNIDPSEVHCTRARLDMPGFRKLCMELAFFSILKTIDGWVQPFRKPGEKP